MTLLTIKPKFGQSVLHSTRLDSHIKFSFMGITTGIVILLASCLLNSKQQFEIELAGL